MGKPMKILNREFEAMKMDVIHEGIKIQYVPDEADLEKWFIMGQAIVDKILEIC